MRISEAVALTRPGSTWAVAALAVFFASGSIGLYVFATDLYSEHRVRDVIWSSYQAQRPGGGRLFGSAYVPTSTDAPPSVDLGWAQVYLLSHPATVDREPLQEMIYLATGAWKAFIDSHKSTTTSVESANDLGVVYLATASQDP